MFAAFLYTLCAGWVTFAALDKLYYSMCMGNFRTPFLLIAMCGPSALAAAPSASNSTSVLSVVSQVGGSLTRMLEAAEVNPVPANSVCTALGPNTGPNGLPVVPAGARLFNVSIPEDEIADTVVEALSLSFTGSGLKLGRDLVLLTGKLTWVPQGQAQVMVATFERGPFAGFFDSRTQHRRERLLFGIAGTQVCVVPG